MSKRVNYKYFLDNENCVELFINFILSDVDKSVEEFVLILFLIIGDERFEVVKYDFSQREKLHIHKFYSQEQNKEFIDKEVSAELIIELKNEIINHWRKYVKLFKQNYYI